MRLLKRLELLRGSMRLLVNWSELFLYGIVLRKWGVRTRQPAVLRFRSGLELEMVRGGYGGYTILFHDLFIRKDYQPTPEFVIRRDWTVLDIGANMGFFACPAAISAHEGRVIAVEPLTAYTDVLRGNIKRNNLTNVAVIQAAAAANSRDRIPLFTWHTKFGELKTGSPRKDVKVSTEVAQGMSMSDIFERGKIERCHLMKVDIEGTEYALFESTPDYIWRKIDRVVMETHPMSGKNVADLGTILRAHGFQVFERRDLLWATREAVNRSSREAQLGRHFIL